MPLGWLFALLAVSLGSAGLLIPRQSELVKRLVEDGRHDRALALVGESMNSGGATNGAPTSVDPTPANLVKVLLDSADHDFDEAGRARIDALVRITDDPKGVLDVLLERRRLIPKELLPDLLDHLAVRAVHANDPALAVSIYGELEQLSPLDLDQTVRHVAACRFSGNPRAALETISRYLQTNRLPFTQLPEDLRKTTVSLHRELNEGSQAFDLLSAEFKATLDPTERHELVDLLTTVAAQSDRLEDSLPILQDYLANTDAGKHEWRELLHRKAPHPSDADFMRFGKLLAQHLEWNNQTSEAFDLYRKLAAMGDLESLDRCITVYPWVDRQEDITDLLETQVPVTDRETYTLLLARLQSERGQFAEAERTYRSELASTHAKDPAVWAEFGGILDAQDRFDEALEAYRNALDLDPERHEVRVKLARLHVTLGNHAAALLAYRKLPAESHDRKTREDYAMIAKSLDSPRDFIHAVQLKIEAEPQTEPGHFL
ncbi:MAG: tetratricopeptide repeat protein, partial [Verrucomicrobiae bacterium]|nr:tetratricopeptide repeat protein [Verrucomicrobiae bacterium]